MNDCITNDYITLEAKSYNYSTHTIRVAAIQAISTPKLTGPNAPAPARMKDSRPLPNLELSPTLGCDIQLASDRGILYVKESVAEVLRLIELVTNQDYHRNRNSYSPPPSLATNPELSDSKFFAPSPSYHPTPSSTTDSPNPLSAIYDDTPPRPFHPPKPSHSIPGTLHPTTESSHQSVSEFPEAPANPSRPATNIPHASTLEESKFVGMGESHPTSEEQLPTRLRTHAFHDGRKLPTSTASPSTTDLGVVGHGEGITTIGDGQSMPASPGVSARDRPVG